MADVLTNCLKFTKPDVGGSDDTWGSKLNTDWDIIDRVYQDMNGALVSTSGTGNAHDVALIHNGYADIDSTNGRRFAIRSGATNTGAMTLNVGDGNGNRPVNKFKDGVSVALEAGDFPIHYVGDFIYIRRSSFNGWVLLNPATGVVRAPPQATTTVVGLTRYATDLEAQNEALATVAITPKNLASVGGTVLPDASTTVKGKVRIATIAEAKSGTSALIAVNPEGLSHAVPSATTAVEGRVELATAAEVQTGTDNTRAVTPAGLPNAGNSERGLIEIATAAEALAGTMQGRAITPSSLAYVFDERVATTTQKGTVEFATGPEATDGTLFNKAINPVTLNLVVDAAVVRALKQHGLIPE